MRSPSHILIYEHDTLVEGKDYDGVEFKRKHFKALCQYLSRNESCPFYTLYYDRIKFNQYVGVIHVEDLTIEVLPKTDKHNLEKVTWQSVLINMLAISLQVQAQTTMSANIEIRKHSVLETYLHHFLDEVEKLIHYGLVKKYRSSVSNQTALKGKLLFHKHVTLNMVHAERFFVEHQVYDRHNVFNAIIEKTLHCIQSMNVSVDLNRRATACLLTFPECTPPNVTEKLFQRLPFNRKTERYRTAIELARIILLNYHPDVKGGRNHILAIMFDMNLLWENYIYMMLKRAVRNLPGVSVRAQTKKKFWQHPDKRDLHLKPDIVLELSSKQVVLDTKWKYRKDTSMEDVRQMYAYRNYFEAKDSYLLYPDRIEGMQTVVSTKGFFYTHDSSDFQKYGCGLLFVDLIARNLEHDKLALNNNIGVDILKNLIPA